MKMILYSIFCLQLIQVFDHPRGVAEYILIVVTLISMAVGYWKKDKQ